MMKDTAAFEESFVSDLPTPEKRLMGAVLYRVIKDSVDNNSKVRREAWQFIFNKSKKKKEWSFNWLCEHLDFNPDIIRKQLNEAANDIKSSEIYKLFYRR